MNHIYKIISFLLIVLSSTSLIAQNSTIDYTITFDKVKIEGQDISVSSTIIKNNNTIVWNQSNNGAFDSSTYTITNTTENWDHSTSTGSISYTMTYEGHQVDLTILGEASGMSAILTFKESDTEQDIYTFKINNISYQ
ncbi:hypothetical protein [Jejuia spongiicola]|uniref:Uncharacterized protein n=1 Tax=Jejuia spongiicola TaxID=2942207 RepID=A0ABT0QD26_9FLAO|nr:hypothetical protein [Jejuia spongiicola]MCL6293890.1 hypothetical protein [Jejuia spongiicola]